MTLMGSRLSGSRIKALREKRGWTQDELGVRMHMDGRQIIRYEKEQTDPSSETIYELAQQLDTSADYLLGLVDDPSPRLFHEDLSAEERALIVALRNRQSTEVIQLVAALSKEPTQ